MGGRNLTPRWPVGPRPASHIFAFCELAAQRQRPEKEKAPRTGHRSLGAWFFTVHRPRSTVHHSRGGFLLQNQNLGDYFLVTFPFGVDADLNALFRDLVVVA